MAKPDFADPRLTERRNPKTTGIDVASSLDIVDLLNAEDRAVPEAVHRCRADIAQAIDLTVTAFRDGGRLVYVGAGTSGRLGVLDAAGDGDRVAVGADALALGGSSGTALSQDGRRAAFVFQGQIQAQDLP